MARTKRKAEPTIVQLKESALRFRALGDPTRLYILSVLGRTGPRSNVEIQELINLAGGTGPSQPTVSHHLRVLRAAGLITDEKRGQFTYNALSMQGVDSMSATFAEVTRAA
jgi:ArsR family transcriptional regulator, arsenate/arsenite/antimonite-responsive transcriptional repressor